MNTVSVNEFRGNLKSFVEQVVSQREPLTVTRRNGEDFVVLGVEDWRREQETLHVLQNTSLMRQIKASTASHGERGGYRPAMGEVDEILGI